MAVIVIEQMDIIGGSPILMDETNMQTQTIAEMPVETSGATIAGTADDVDEEFEPPLHDQNNPVHTAIIFVQRMVSVSELAYATRYLLPIKTWQVSQGHVHPFAASDSARSLLPNEKRNMVYWWYETNIFLICGKGNCGPLPECLLYAIRCQKYLNPNGLEYVGFLESEDRQTKVR